MDGWKEGGEGGMQKRGTYVHIHASAPPAGRQATMSDSLAASDRSIQPSCHFRGLTRTSSPSPSALSRVTGRPSADAAPPPTPSLKLYVFRFRRAPFRLFNAVCGPSRSKSADVDVPSAESTASMS
mmetsp:Transcript_16358/g.46568  ORF Transcript_16358/g.46568 Transcript_16358/m.46568 type:complete len:126 (-) Transcript_16358:210-587(-)